MKKLNSLFLSALLFCFIISVFHYGCKKKDNTPAETCSDGIKNQDETGIDCGGSCTPCATCSDGIKNQDETGIDCGGVCPACVSSTMSAKIDGVQWNANYISGTILGGSLAIQGAYTATTQGISIAYSGTFAVGTYPLGMLDGNYAVSTPSAVNCIIQTGSITFTTFNTTTKTVSGSFNFTCTDSSTGKSQTISSGVFTNIKYK